MSSGRRLTAILAAAIAFPVTFCVAAYVAAELLISWATGGYTGPGSGDGAAWLLAFTAPLAIGPLLLVAGVGSGVAYWLVVRRAAS